MLCTCFVIKQNQILNGRDRKIPLVIKKRGHFRIDNDVRESSLFYHIDNYFDEYA